MNKYPEKKCVENKKKTFQLTNHVFSLPTLTLAIYMVVLHKPELDGLSLSIMFLRTFFFFSFHGNSALS